MTDRQLDSLDFSREEYDAIPRSMAFAAKTRDEARQWQKRLRRKLVQLMGGFPKEACALRPEVVGQARLTTTDGKREYPYTRETVLFQSRGNLTVYAYLLLPDKVETPAPVVICAPGHGRGCDDIVGLNEDGSLRASWGDYQNDFALQCVANGFAALAIEQLCFGHRRNAAARAAGGGSSSCQPTSGAALLFGQTMIGWRVYDAMRSVDYLCTRSEIDPARIGMMGISGGGTTTFHTACVEQRIKAAVVSGYFNTFRDSIMSIAHCMDNYVPGVLNYAEMYDLAGLVAPRALFAESGTKDCIFPIKATRYAFQEAKKIYRVLGAEEKIGLQVFRGEHSFYGKGAFRFLKEWL